jgi:hypothetical protein
MLSISLRRRSMMRHALAAALTLVAGLAAAPASACAVHQPLDLRTALSADLVVVGRIVNHNVDPNGTDHFDVAVAEVLRGRAGGRVAVRHSDRMLGPLRSLPRRPVLIALRSERGGYVVLWHICSDPFLLPAGSAQANATRRLLRQTLRRH